MREPSLWEHNEILRAIPLSHIQQVDAQNINDEHRWESVFTESHHAHTVLEARDPHKVARVPDDPTLHSVVLYSVDRNHKQREVRLMTHDEQTQLQWVDALESLVDFLEIPPPPAPAFTGPHPSPYSDSPHTPAPAGGRYTPVSFGRRDSATRLRLKAAVRKGQGYQNR
uniref:PH domain-containing protein n=1 Tax=Phaeomonas parva TaxID=124430 RepID=A0A7S1UI88_9STRA